MDTLELLLSIINNAKKIVELTEKISVDESESYFFPIQKVGSEAERIDLKNFPVSDPVVEFVNSLLGNIAGSKRFTFTVSSATQTIFNIGEPFNSTDVVLDRVSQIEGVDYSVSGTNIILTTPAQNGSILNVRIHTSSNSAITEKTITIATSNQISLDLGRSFDTVDVFLNRIYQIDTIDYNVSGNIITFSTALDLDDIVQTRTFGE